MKSNIRTPEYSHITLYRAFTQKGESRKFMDNLYPLQEVTQDDGDSLEGRIDATYISITPECMRVSSYLTNEFTTLTFVIMELQRILAIPLEDFTIESLGMKVGVYAGYVAQEYVKQIDSVRNFQKMKPSSQNSDTFQATRTAYMYNLFIDLPELSYSADGRIFNVFTADNSTLGNKFPNLEFELICFGNSLSWLQDRTIGEVLIDEEEVASYCLRELCHTYGAIRRSCASISTDNQNPALLHLWGALNQKFKKLYMSYGYIFYSGEY